MPRFQTNPNKFLGLKKLALKVIIEMTISLPLRKIGCNSKFGPYTQAQLVKPIL